MAKRDSFSQTKLSSLRLQRIDLITPNPHAPQERFAKAPRCVLRAIGLDHLLTRGLSVMGRQAQRAQ